jgi:predicted Na+-dependent transporter
VATNILGVVTVPLLATWLVSVKDVKINTVSLLIKLTSTVLIPLIVSYIFIFLHYFIMNILFTLGM